MKNPVFTAFTPTFNRAHTLHRVYDSLCAQTFKDFEWVIVDDGSTDDTEAIVKRWQEEADFEIRYEAQENRGKHEAFNRGVELARGELFKNFDSDDACVPHALERLYEHWKPIKDDPQFSGVIALSEDQHGNLVGDPFPERITRGTWFDLHYILKSRGDKWGFTRTSLLRRFPYPRLEKPGLVPEAIVWSKIDERLEKLFVNERLGIVFRDESDRTDQLTQAPPGRFSEGLRMYHNFILNEHIDWFRHAPVEFIKSSVHVSRFGLHEELSLTNQYRDIDPPLSKLLWIVGVPAGIAVYLRDQFRSGAQAH